MAQEFAIHFPEMENATIVPGSPAVVHTNILTAIFLLLSRMGFCNSVFLSSLIYVAILVIRRLWFSPISKFPGPLLARTTFWYEFYHNWFKTGSYYLRIRDMHEKYGPIVRVTPNELHVAEPSFYSEIFVSGAVRKTANYPRFGNGTGFEDMTAVSTDHDMHRRARAPLSPFFSVAGITRVEPRLIARVKKFGERLEEFRCTGEVVNLTNAFSSLTTDIISCVIFEEPSDYLGDPNFNAEWYEMLKRGTISVPLFAHLPFTRLVAVPILRHLTDKVSNWRVWDDKATRQILTSKLRPSDEAKTREDTTVFDHLVHSELTEAQFGKGGFARLAQLIQQAGAHNVSHTLGTVIVYLLQDPGRLDILRNELKSFYNEDPEETPEWRDLKQAPYLTSCIKEGLRMAIGGMNRTPRVSPYEELYFKDWIIPKGTPVSMSSYWMHTDPNVFPEPEKFRPERWLKSDPEKLKVMQSYYVPFALGSRNCLGQNLVHMQLYHTVAYLFRPGAPKISLASTDETDVRAIHGLLFPLPRLDSKGVQAHLW